MGYDRYQFAIAAIRCLNREDANDGPASQQPSYKQCMCDAGMTSYCPLGMSTTASPSAWTTWEPWSPMDSWERINSNSLSPENDVFPADPDLASIDWSDVDSGPSMGSGFMWVSLLVLIACSICLMYGCKNSDNRQAGGSREDDSGRRQSSPRFAGESRSRRTTAADNGGGGGGGGGGSSDRVGAGAATCQVTSPADPPPPYELVFNDGLQPPPYETVCREVTKTAADHPV